MKIAIMGLGIIARKMAQTITAVKDAQPYAVASRSLEKATAFAKEFGFEKAYGSYEQMLDDPEVQLVYISTPHSRHYEDMLMCLQHGKPVLCEKAFTLNAEQARRVFAVAKEQNLLVAEAIWTRYLPMRKRLDEILASGVLGKITALTANLGYPLESIQRLTDPELAGGALLDVGVYPINFALMAFGSDFEHVASSMVPYKTGVDAQEHITLTYRDGRMAMLFASMMCSSDRKGMVFGTEGFLEFENINNCEGINVYNKEHQLIQSFDPPPQINGFEYELIEAMEAVRSHKTECRSMPHKETLKVLELMDALRQQWGIRYPME